MAEIKLSELNLAGCELLQNSESFLDELGDREIENVVGGHNVTTSLPGQNSLSAGTICTVTPACPQTQTFVTF